MDSLICAGPELASWPCQCSVARSSLPCFLASLQAVQRLRSVERLAAGDVCSFWPTSRQSMPDARVRAGHTGGKCRASQGQYVQLSVTHVWRSRHRGRGRHVNRTVQGIQDTHTQIQGRVLDSLSAFELARVRIRVVITHKTSPSTILHRTFGPPSTASLP